MAVVAMIGFASCTKSKNCECTYEMEGIEAVTVPATEYKVKNCSDIDAAALNIANPTADLKITCTEK